MPHPRRAASRRGPSGVRMLFQHNPAEPIGIWETLAEDAKGLFVRGRLMPTVAWIGIVKAISFSVQPTHG